MRRREVGLRCFVTFPEVFSRVISPPGSLRERKKRGRAHLVDEAVSVEGVLAREDVELSREELLSTAPAPFRGIDDHEPVAEVRNVGLDRLGRPGRVVHVALEALNVGRVALERGADLVLEVVDDDKVGEEGQDVFNLEEVRRFEEPHRTAGPRVFKCPFS